MSAITKGSTHRFQLSALKDGVTWDLTGATVTLSLTDPENNEATYTATLSATPTNGIAYYDVATTVLDQAGTWSRVWKVIQSGVTMWSARQNFHVARGA